jgi:hypothetical protein
MHLFQKKIILFISGILFLLISQIYPIKPKTAVEYLDQLSTHSDKLIKSTWDYIRVASHRKGIFQSEAKRRKLIATLKKAIRDANKLPGYENDNFLKDALLENLNTQLIILEGDYGKLVDMEKIAEESYDQMEAFIKAKELATEKLNTAADKFIEKVKEFAKKNNIILTIEKNEMVQKIEISKEVYNYYNDIFLIFFKINKQEFYLIQAQNKADVNELEQNRTALIKLCNEALKKLKSKKPYKNDKSLLDVTKKVAIFYKKEAEEKFPFIIDFYMKRENFAKIQESFKKKKKSDHTQEDIDKYNEEVNIINDMINKYNKINGELNTERIDVTQEWNETGSSFIDKNVPQ